MARGRKPQASSDQLRAGPVQAPNHDQSTPYFCLNCQRSGYTVEELDQDGQLAFLMALHRRRSMTWAQLRQAPRHGLGYEKIAAGSLPGAVPPAFADQDSFIAFRYHGKLPMVGARVGAVFHVLWIERAFGDVYRHG